MISLYNVAFEYACGEDRAATDADARPNAASATADAPATADGRIPGYALKPTSLHIAQGECLLLAGESGCGKTTLLRLINGLIPQYYDGSLSGEVLVGGRAVATTPLWANAEIMGTVFQNPRSQFFNVDAESEVAFGCENLGMPQSEIIQRVAQAMTDARISHLAGRSLFELSGGEKQRIACASVAALRPKLLILDEPSSNLDMRAIASLRRMVALWKSQGKTIVIAEHRLHYLEGLADRILLLADGEVIAEHSWESLRSLSPKQRHKLGLRALSLRDLGQEAANSGAPQTGGRLSLSKFCFSYKRGQLDRPALDIAELELPRNAVIAVIGRNGAGKTSFARCLCGLEKRCPGTLRASSSTGGGAAGGGDGGGGVGGGAADGGADSWAADSWAAGGNKAGYAGSLASGRALAARRRRKSCFMVMQDVNHQLFTESVLDEVLLSMGRKPDCDRALAILDGLRLKEFADTHPLALSGGQRQRVAIATALASGREIIIFDEPTSGLDLRHMRQVAASIVQLKHSGQTVLVVTHDPELIGSCCTQLLHLECGRVVENYPLDAAGRKRMLRFFLDELEAEPATEPATEPAADPDGSPDATAGDGSDGSPDAAAGSGSDGRPDADV